MAQEITFEQLKALNPGLSLFHVNTPEFSGYGRLLSVDVSVLINCANQIKRPDSGSEYFPSVPEFEKLPVFKKWEEEIFGGMPMQLGYCHGHSNQLDATEWHNCSELNVAVTPLVLILGRIFDLENGHLQTGKMKAFYVPAGTVLEIFPTTLHFCPCEVQKAGFGCVVGLTKGTNTPLEGQKPGLLFRKNKWLLAHPENRTLLQKGVVAGLEGENYTVYY